jgi:tetratricopeptide (TPR) repeat protein
VDFLRVWHDRQDIEQRLVQLTSASPDHRYYAEALALLDSGAPNLRHEILREGLDNLSPDQCEDDALNRARCLAEESDLPADWSRFGWIQWARKEWTETIQAFTRVIDSKAASVAEVALALNMRGSAFSKFGSTEEAIEDWTRVIRLPGIMPGLLAWSFVQRGTHLDGKEAIADFTSAIEIQDAPALALESALIGRSFQYGRAERHDEAIADLSRVVDMPGVSADGAALALIGRSQQNFSQGREDEAIADISRAIGVEGISAERLALALCYRGHLLSLTDEPETAVADLTKVIQLPGASTVVISQALSLIALFHAHSGLSELALQNLARLLATPCTVAIPKVITPGIPVYAEHVIQNILAHTTDPQRWTTRLREFLPLFARHGGLAQLGDALVQHLPKLAASPLNHDAYDAWATAWSEALDVLSPEDQDRLEIPLRLLRAGIDYLKTQHVGSLLVLPAEERRILRQTLGLPAETQE